MGDSVHQKYPLVEDTTQQLGICFYRRCSLGTNEEIYRRETSDMTITAQDQVVLKNPAAKSLQNISCTNSAGYEES